MILVAVTRENTKHDYKINFSTAVNICRHYLKNGEAEVINPTKEKQGLYVSGCINAPPL